MTDGQIIFLFALGCAVLLDILLMRMVRKRYSARYEAARGNLLSRVLNRFPFLARLGNHLPSKFTAIFKFRPAPPRQWTAVPPITLLLVGAGLVLLCVGQLQRQDWAHRGPTSLVVLGMGLLLLARGMLMLANSTHRLGWVPGEAGNDKNTPADPVDDSSTPPELRPKSWITPELALLGAGVLLSLLSLPDPSLRGPSAGWPAGWLALGVTSFSAGAWSLRKGIPGWLARGFAWLEKTFEITPDRAIFLLTGLALAVFATRTAGPGQLMPHPVLSIGAWAGGIGLSVLGAWRPAQRVRINGRAVALGLGLALLSLPLRTIGAATLPLGLTGDEGSAGFQSLQFLQGGYNNIFITGWFAFPTLYFAIQAWFIALFGQTAEALRYSSAFAGALGVAVTYWVARAMFGRRVALLAGLFLVVFHFHITYSRIGLNNVWDALFFTWVLGAFWIGWARHSRGAFVLAGLGLGLGLYFYVTTRLLFLLVPGLALVFAWVQPQVQRRRLQTYLPHLILTLLVALAVMLPLAWHFIQRPGQFMAPIDRVKLTVEWYQPVQKAAGAADLRGQLGLLAKGLQAYTDLPTNVLYAPGSPLLQTIPAVLWWVCAAVFLTRWRDTRFWLLAGWLAALALVGALSVYPPGGHRYIAAAPGLAIIVGVGLARLMALVETIFNGPKWLATVAAAGLLVVSGVQDARLLYRYDSSVGFGGYNNMIAQSLAEILRQEPRGTLVYFMGGQEMNYQSIPSLPYLAPHINGVYLPVPWTPDLAGPPDRWNALLVYLPRRADEISAVQVAYPAGRLSSIYAPDGQLIFYLFDPCPPYPYPARMVLPATSLGLPYAFLRKE